MMRWVQKVIVHPTEIRNQKSEGRNQKAEG